MVFHEHRAGELTIAITLQEPKSVFASRDLPVDQLIPYELMSLVSDAGWEWQRWVPPSQRSKRMEGHFKPYTSGQPKLWYCAGTPGVNYLQALLSADELLGQGLEDIGHGLSEKQYSNYLKGRFERLDDTGDLLPPDLDADADVPVLADHLGEGVAADSVPPEQESDQNEDDVNFEAALETFLFE